MTAATSSSLVLDPVPPSVAPQQPATPARVSFRQPVTDAAHVDGAWWPRSRNLEIELPGLLAVFWTACREVDRVSYHLDSWLPAPRRLSFEGRQIRLAGFTHQDVSMIGFRDS